MCSVRSSILFIYAFLSLFRSSTSSTIHPTSMFIYLTLPYSVREYPYPPSYSSSNFILLPSTANTKTKTDTNTKTKTSTYITLTSIKVKVRYLLSYYDVYA